MKLGFNTGADFQALDSISVPAFTVEPDMDDPNYDPPPSSSAFATLKKTRSILIGPNGVLPSGSLMSLLYAIDTPDDSQFSTYSSFTLRETPIGVPEPPSFILLSLASAGMLLRTRRYR